MSEELKRAVRMMEVACSFIENNCPFGTAHYDGTECDGFCLSEDLSSASEDLQNAWNTRSDLAVEVKPLVWDDYRSGAAKAPSLMLASYLITQWGDDQFELVESAPGYQGQRIGDGLFPRLEAAKAAAQDDHNAKVRSELILRPNDLRPKLQALVTKWEGMTCRTKCAQELRKVLEGGE